MLDEVAGESRRARRAVALADEEERRLPALILRQVEADKLADRLDVALQTEISLREFGARGAAVARADRIDEDEIGRVEPRLLVVNETERRRGHLPVGHHLDA